MQLLHPLFLSDRLDVVDSAQMIQEGVLEITDDAVPGQEIDNDIHK